MVSFLTLWENIHKAGPESPDMRAIRTGLNVCDEFWDHFIQACNNIEAMADLLGVRTEQVAGWPGRVRAALDRVKDADQKPQDDTKTKILDTGGLPEETA